MARLDPRMQSVMMLESNEFQVEFVEHQDENISTSQHSSNNNLDQVLQIMCACCRIKGGWGRTWTCLKRNPCLRVKCKSISASTKVRWGLPQLQFRHMRRLRLGSPCKRVCVASKRTRLEKLFLARGRLSNSIDAESIKLYPGEQASIATQRTLLRNGTQGPRTPLVILLSCIPHIRGQYLLTCRTIRIEKEVLTEKRLA
jgi:hypothetical protein